ncbi:hypothetical protein ACT3RU_17190 [Halomonas sp. TP35]
MTCCSRSFDHLPGGQACAQHGIEAATPPDLYRTLAIRSTTFPPSYAHRGRVQRTPDDRLPGQALPAGVSVSLRQISPGPTEP